MEVKNKAVIQDLTIGSVPKKLMYFATPLFLSGMLQTIYNMVDMIVAGNVIGGEGLVAVSLGGDVLTLLTFVAMGLSNAGQIVISRYVGANEKDKVGKVIATLFVLLMGSAIVLTGLCLLIYPTILKWLNTPAESYQMACDYIAVCICGLVFIYGYNMASAIMRGVGDSKRPFIFITIASVVNVVLDILFVYGLHMGTFGAALATVIGQGVSFLFAITVLYRIRHEIHFAFKRNELCIHMEVLKPLISLGIPMMIQSAAITFSRLFVNSWINVYGVSAVAITGIGHKLEMVIGVVGQGLSSAGGTMVAQNIGAHKYERIPRIIGTALIIMLIVGVCMLVPTVLFPHEVFGLFVKDEGVLAMTTSYIPVTIILYIGCVLRPPMFALINGTGNSKLNLAVAILDGIVTRIGLAFLLGVVFDWGIHGFWYGNAFSGLVPFFIGGIY